MFFFLLQQLWVIFVIQREHVCWQLPTVVLRYHGGFISPSVVFAENHDMLYSFYMDSISAFMPIQYMDLHTSSVVFSIPIWLLCSWFNICFCSSLGIMSHLPFSIIPSITAISSLKVQFNLISCGPSFLPSGKPMAHSLSCWSGDVWLLPIVFLVWSCSLECLLHWCLFPCPVFHYLVSL